MGRHKGERLDNPGERSYTPAPKVIDGRFYSEPEPNPFTQAWNAGYANGFEGGVFSFDGTAIDLARYADGFHCGEEERKELDRASSSNT